MKKIISRLFSSVIIMLLVNCTDSELQPNDLSKLELNGSVKYLKETSKFNVLSKILNEEIEYFFNRNGNVEKRINFLNEKIYQYDYGNDNKLIKISIYNLNKELKYYSDFKYYEDDKLKEYKLYNIKNELQYYVTYEYSKDSINNIVKTEKKFDSINKLVSNSKEIIDSENKVIGTIIFDSDNSVQQEYQYTYDSNGNNVGSSKLNSLGDIDWESENIYDSKNHLLKKILKSTDSVVNHTWEFEYELDLYDNWTKKTTKEKEETKKLIERYIEYYQ